MKLNSFEYPFFDLWQDSFISPVIRFIIVGKSLYPNGISNTNTKRHENIPDNVVDGIFKPIIPAGLNLLARANEFI